MSGRLADSGSYSITYNVPYWFKRMGMRYSRQMELTDKAKRRLSMLECYQTLRDVSATCRIFKVSRKNFYKWKDRYEASGEDPTSLEDQSRAPHTTRHVEIAQVQEERIKRLREKHIRLGKKKLQILYRKYYNEYISCNHIQYVIQKHNLYYDPVSAKKIRTKKNKGRGATKMRINQINMNSYMKKKDKPFFFCTDTIALYLPYGVKRYILTAVEYKKKIAYARCYKSKSSTSTFDFLLRLHMLVDGQIAAILSDNGSEFADLFDKACKKMGIDHIYTRLRTPKDNAVDERFNRTIQEEFMETDLYFEPSLTNNDLTEANRYLTSWLIFYNFDRPHQTLDYLSPVEYYDQRIKSLSPMYPSLTAT